MLILGLILAVVGFLIGSSLILDIGILLLVVGCVLLLIRPGGRNYY